jgi:hypothetical protein
MVEIGLKRDILRCLVRCGGVSVPFVQFHRRPRSLGLVESRMRGVDFDNRWR